MTAIATLKSAQSYSEPLAPRMAAVTLSELDEVQTPAYIFDAAVVRARYAALRAALGTHLIVSLKANSLADVLVRCAAAFVDGVELASISELATAVGRVAATKFVNNPSMQEEFMRAAASSACVFIVDSLDQAERIAMLGRSSRGPLRALLRLNVGMYRGVARPDHFGMGAEEAVAATEVLRRGECEVFGAHAFGGSYGFSAEGLVHMRAVTELIDGLQSRVGGLSYVNLGGGFAEDWEERPQEIARYREALAPLAARYTLAHESGRGIFARAGAFVTRVVATKTLDARRIVVCDGGMAQNFLLAMTEGVLRKHRRPALLPQREAHAAVFELQFAGSSCSRQDVIGIDPHASALPLAGDYCVFDDCGAYNSTYTMAQFLSLPPAKSYLRAERPTGVP
jgi:diaminopimelate decarboxylase